VSGYAGRAASAGRVSGGCVPAGDGPCWPLAGRCGPFPGAQVSSLLLPVL